MAYNADTLKKQYQNNYQIQRIANLIELREKIAKLSLTEFSKQIGIQKSNLSSIENGDRDLSLFNIQAYKTFFHEKYNLDISTDYLLGYSNNKYANENYQMISKITGLNDNSIDCLKELQQYGKMTHGTLVLNCLMKNEQLFKKLLANVGIVLDLFDWEFVTVEYKDDNTELVDYYPLPDERYVALAQKAQNGNNNGCLILDHTILKDTAYVRIQEILSEYNNKGSD